MKKEIVWAFVAGIVLCWWTSSSPAKPDPTPTDRPVLRWIARAAKSFLWIALVAERQPTDKQCIVHTSVGDDGFAVVDHSQGW
jgi:hypothetical protein